MSSNIMERRVEALPRTPKDLAMSPLSTSQRSEMWDITEDDFWRKNDAKRQDEYAQLSQRWQQHKQSAIAHIRSLEAEARGLREKEEHLSRELMAVRSQAALVNETHNNETQRLSDMDMQQNMEKQELLKNHERIERKMQNWFKHCRNNDGVQERQWALPELIDKRPAERQLQPPKLPSLDKLDLPGQHPKHEDRIVAIIDADGTILDKLQYLGLSNEHTAAISARPVRQPIKYRISKRYVEDIRPSIYNFDDGKGTRWLACMIQATGIVQNNKCKACQTGESPFEGCIVVDDPLFPKCGNCEWNGTKCCGLEPMSPGDKSILARRSSSLAPLRIRSHSLTSTSPKFARLSLESPGNVAFAEMEALAAAAKEASAKAYDAVSYSPPYTSTTGFKAVNKTPRYEPISPATASTVTSLVPSSANSYRRGSKASSCPTSRQLTPQAMRTMDFAISSSDEIVNDNLVLRHNGIFYTYPKCIEGVPVEKIYPGHPYWESKWPDLRAVVEPILRSWEEKHQEAKEACSRGEHVGSVKYQYGRQVNRGNAILKFLEQGPISPYQLLSKRFMSVGKGSITSYDTLFRLCETLEALAGYKTDADPVDWMRQRLHELIEVQGAGFNFSKTIHDFYNDPKLAALRVKSGFKNIGRPSGIKMPRRRGGSADEPASLLRKRKSPHSCGTPSPPAESVGEPATTEDEGPDGKRQRAAAKVLDSLDTGEISDADSWSGAPIAEYDFRIYQIKTRLFTSSERVTQYWGWVPEHSMFEHQVLEEANPVVWGVHREPIDFSLRLEDVVKISWNLKALRVYLVMSDRHICFEDDKPRGDVMVAFKRENTMRRFIKFCRQEEIELVEETWKKMEHLWTSMRSEPLPAGDEEPSTRLKE
ncbi:hypothetical protein NLG97_g3698 [Lecanicillium saksenae]|uniref:Uncharacterized protein n=1 Tax=Lecanicillium saksenae TaxID=468837 RepID=A0ACC1QXB8_9HYPO|nr:hypothetical protein NLG97_g3698 [Lecanicillium saksenae]